MCAAGPPNAVNPSFRNNFATSYIEFFISSCKQLAEQGGYDALVALGCIIRGETYHFELVANESAAGVSRVALDYRLPVANVILTTENMEQAIARQTDKGVDAARVCVEMANLLDHLS